MHPDDEVVFQQFENCLRPGLSEEFRSASPFPVLVIDDFLPSPLADALYNEVKAVEVKSKSRDYIFAKNKFEYPDLDEVGPVCRQLHKFWSSAAFSSWLSELRGEKVFLDPQFLGGGIHKGGVGSYLDMHADFSRHPGQSTWIRELNILFYLNKGWQPEFKGSLELRCANTGGARSIEPRFNRLVVMLTKDHTLHGYKPINFPIGMYRTSIAGYAYSEAISASGGSSGSNYKTTTTWYPEGSAWKRVVSRHADRLVALKQRVFGSSTERRAKKRKID